MNSLGFESTQKTRRYVLYGRFILYNNNKIPVTLLILSGEEFSRGMNA
jgi:hypothetical protein